MMESPTTYTVAPLSKSHTSSHAISWLIAPHAGSHGRQVANSACRRGRMSMQSRHAHCPAGRWPTHVPLEQQGVGPSGSQRARNQPPEVRFPAGDVSPVKLRLPHRLSQRWEPAGRPCTPSATYSTKGVAGEGGVGGGREGL